MDSKKMKELRDYMAEANLDAVEVIEKAITIAAFYQPEKLAEATGPLIALLLRCSPTACTTASNSDGDLDLCDSSRERRGDEGGLNINATLPVQRGGRLEEEEKLTEVEEEQVHVKVPTEEELLVLKNAISSQADESDVTVLLEHLKNLRKMAMTLEIIEKTEIGVAVNMLRRRHKSEEVRQVASDLYVKWIKSIAEEWVMQQAKANHESVAARQRPYLKTVKQPDTVSTVEDFQIKNDDVDKNIPSLKIRVRIRERTAPMKPQLEDGHDDNTDEKEPKQPKQPKKPQREEEISAVTSAEHPNELKQQQPKVAAASTVQKLHPHENLLKEMMSSTKRKLQRGYEMEASKKRKIITSRSYQTKVDFPRETAGKRDHNNVCSKLTTISSDEMHQIVDLRHHHS